MKILVLNSGSSSLKYQLIDMNTEEVLAKGNYERIGQYNSFLTHKVGGEKRNFEKPATNHEKAITFVLSRLLSDQYGVIKSVDEIDGIGHRIVHGGEKFTKPVIITDEVLEGIRDCIDLAPLHNPAAILGIEACRAVMPGKTNVAVFDTAFHQTIPEESYIYPIPYEYYERYKIRRYGFHGVSHEYVAGRVAEIVNKPLEELKIINC
ncbi:MAG: acetate kinase, partial [Clostridia bacterium]|nr:acetate kinase [Clostridia bacterium]